MQPVFDRNAGAAHPYEPALDEWLRAGGEAGAMACNFHWDFRVSQLRENREFDPYVRINTSDGSGLRKALKDYFDARVRQQRNPAFLDLATNGHNIVHGGPNNLESFAPERKLATILDLNQLGREYAKMPPLSTGLRPFDPSFDDDARLEWLNERLKGKTLAEKTTFVRAVFDQLTLTRQSQAFQPVWVTFWDDFIPFFHLGVDRWCEVVGVPKYIGPTWLVVLQYTVAEAGTLVRPTQLDASWFACHFPSPTTRPLHDGGCAMDLDTKSGPAVVPSLLPEFIHPQIDFRVSFIEAIECTSAAITYNSNMLQQVRQRHRTSLANHYSFPTWMLRVI